MEYSEDVRIIIHDTVLDQIWERAHAEKPNIVEDNWIQRRILDNLVDRNQGLDIYFTTSETAHSGGIHQPQKQFVT